MLDETTKRSSLLELSAAIDGHEDWWRFPAEREIRGFLGTGPIFIVGDQPSTSAWTQGPWPQGTVRWLVASGHGKRSSHRSLQAARARWRTQARPPARFGDHVALFRREIAVLDPTRVVALGALAHELIAEHVPEVKPILARMWHFAYVVRSQKFAIYDDHMRSVLLPHLPSTTTSEAKHTRVRQVAATPRAGPDAGGTSLSTRVDSVPSGAHRRTWTLRRDNNAHHHGVVSIAESPLYLDLSWRLDAASPASHVGVFRLDLPKLLAAGLIRTDPVGSSGPRARLRIILRNDVRFYIQTREGAPCQALQ